MDSVYIRAYKLHKKLQGKLSIKTKVKPDKKNLSLLYTPGVGGVAKEIAKNKNLVNELTWRGNTVAIVSDGTAVLGLGNVGPYAALPVMEGKALLFKSFADIDAIPICLEVKTPDELIDTVRRLAPSFGGINLEDISSPACFYIEQKLEKILDIPVFHDDQHGTAIVVYAGLHNALKIRGTQNKKNLKIVINGAGAAGIAVAKFLLKTGFRNIILCDRNGILYKDRKKGMNNIKKEIAKKTNPDNIRGNLKDALIDADVFIGLSTARILTAEMIRLMKKDPVIFALANPEPEIFPEEAKKAGARIIATGRSDFPNQVNNLLAFPAIFKGAFLKRAKKITFEMKLRAALSIAKSIPENKLSEKQFIPPVTKKLINRVAHAVAEV